MSKVAKPWTLTGAARAARDARISAARFMRTSPLEREWHATMLAAGHELRTAEAESPEAARALFFAVMGYPRRTRPAGGRPAR